MFCIEITNKKSILKGDDVKNSSIASNRTLIENMNEILSKCFKKHESIDIIIKDKQLKQICINELSFRSDNQLKVPRRIKDRNSKLFCKMSRDGSNCRVNFNNLMSFTNQSYSMIDCIFSLMNDSKVKKTEMGMAVETFIIESVYYIGDFLLYYENETNFDYDDSDNERVLVKDMMRILSLVYLYEFYEDNEELLGIVCAHGMHHKIIEGYINQLNTGRRPKNISGERLDILLREYLLYILQRR